MIDITDLLTYSAKLIIIIQYLSSHTILKQSCHEIYFQSCMCVSDFRKRTAKEIDCLFHFLLPRLTISALGIKLNDYWKEVTEKQAREREFQALDRYESEEESANDE